MEILSIQKPTCPKCNSVKVWQYGKYRLMFAEIQRWMCQDCNYVFSDPKDLIKAHQAAKKDTQILKGNVDLLDDCQIGVKGAKNLVAEHALVIPQKHDIYDAQTLKGAVVEFLFHMKKQGKSKDTYEPYTYSLEYLIKAGANLFDPESVKAILATTLEDKTKVRKYNLVKAYKAFITAYGIEAKLPKFIPDRPLPYLPPEEHMDQLIASCNQEIAVYLQTLKETAARPIEALRVEWKELDFINKKIPINHPAKGCNARVLDMSDKLYSMLKNLPQDGRKHVFIYKNPQSAAKTFRVMRKRAVRKLGIPELSKIHIYTFRYWRATREFQLKQSEAAVMILLGHKSLKYLLLYVQLSEIYFGGKREYEELWVYNREQESRAVREGFDYIRTDSKDGASLYRRAK